MPLFVKQKRAFKRTQSSDSNSGLSSAGSKLVLGLTDIEPLIIQPDTCSQTQWNSPYFSITLYRSDSTQQVFTHWQRKHLISQKKSMLMAVKSSAQ